MAIGNELPDRVDVVVIGGGVVGTSAAFFLASESDRETLLLEKNSIGSGSTGDSSSILRHHYGGKEVYSRMAKMGHEFYREFEEHTGEEVAYRPNPLVRLGVEGEPSGRDARAGYDVFSKLGLPVSELDREELEERFPMLDLEGVDFGVVDESAAISDAAGAAGGFARAAGNEGATVATGVAVEEILVENGVVVGVETTQGRVATDAVVVAAGPWTNELLEPLGLEVPIWRRRERIILVDPSEEFAEKYPDGPPTTSAPGADWYTRADFGGGVLMATHHTGEDVDPDAYSNSPSQEVILELIDQLAGLIPELADAGLQATYCGLYSETPDRDFVIDRAGPEGLVLACGFSGHGFKHAPPTGRIVRDLVVDGETDLLDIERFRFDRFDESTEFFDGRDLTVERTEGD